MTEKIIEGGGLWQGRLHFFDSLPSTNAWALRNADALRHGDIVTAAKQTAGRGRFDRSWLMPGDKGIALTVVLKGIEKEDIRSNIGRAAALAVHDCLDGFAVESAVKWPNDVIAGGRKICGILAEMDSGSIFLGVGLNVNMTAADFKAANLDKTATSMLIERGISFDLEDVRTKLISSLGKWTEGLLRDGVGFIEKAWASCDWLAGGSVEIDTAAGRQRGRYAGVDPAGRLRLIDSAGATHSFWSGDVRKVTGAPAKATHQVPPLGAAAGNEMCT